MKATTLSLASALVLSAALIGCGKPVPPPPTQTQVNQQLQALEDNRSTSSDNALFLAQKYRAENPRFLEGDWKIVPHADTAISPDCPQGSGWADLSVMKVEGKQVDKITIICSTHSLSLGCYRKEDYLKKAFGGEEGKCQDPTKVPFPLKKLTSSSR